MQDKKVFETSIFPNKEIEFVKQDQASMPTWALLVALVVVFVILKVFIYIKDPKRMK